MTNGPRGTSAFEDSIHTHREEAAGPHRTFEDSIHTHREEAAGPHRTETDSLGPVEVPAGAYCSLDVSCRDLAVMGATLADGGVNPLTGERVVSQAVCHRTLAVMATAGLYETSGDWLYEIGLPGKSGIGGGIVTVSPGKGGLGTFAPPLDAAGTSVKGRLAAPFLAQALGLNLFLSSPAG